MNTDLNEAARPKMPPIPGATEDDRRKGGHLRLIHDHYRQDMKRIAAVLARIKAGDDAPEELQAIILSTDMARNLHAAGTLCGHQCRALIMHHDIEQGHMFPGLEAAGNNALTRVVAKLRAEHEVIHALLISLQTTAETLTKEPTEANFAAVHIAFIQLDRAIASHFGYEEEELAEAIGCYLNGI